MSAISLFILKDFISNFQKNNWTVFAQDARVYALVSTL